MYLTRMTRIRLVLPLGSNCFFLTSLFIGCIFSGESKDGFVISDHSDHGASKEPTNPLWTRIRRFLWCTMIRMIWDHKSVFDSLKKTHPIVFSKNANFTKELCLLSYFFALQHKGCQEQLFIGRFSRPKHSTKPTNIDTKRYQDNSVIGTKLRN